MATRPFEPETITCNDPQSFDEAVRRIRAHNSFCFQCVYVRPNGSQFELVAQWIKIVADDFSLDEEVLATADTPLGLPLYSVGRDFTMPPHPVSKEYE